MYRVEHLSDDELSRLVKNASIQRDEDDRLVRACQREIDRRDHGVLAPASLLIEATSEVRDSAGRLIVWLLGRATGQSRG